MNGAGMAESLLESYETSADRYDEMLMGSGRAREHWSFFMDSLEHLGAGELEHRRREIERLLRESGVTYTVYGDDEGETEDGADSITRERPWTLDPIPNLIDSNQWSSLEQGLRQRAVLLDLILRDLYGPRELLRKGLLPPELVFAHGGFLRPCHGLNRGGRFLSLYAADLGRTREGDFMVMADRAQAPSGAGYALENRIVLSRVLPSLFRDSQVHRLALYFRALREMLAEAAPGGGDDPRIVLLTPGRNSETFFEHAFLAGYLGYPLVQGADLTVREGKVWFNTLEGERRVDVILRRLDDRFADPLELKPDSLLGVPGLLQAARLGNVAIVNPPGSGMVENPALAAFLPELSRKLLGQELRLPSAPTYWCGHPEHLQYVRSRFQDMVLLPFEPGSLPKAVIAGGARVRRNSLEIHFRDLSSQAASDVLKIVASAPHAFAAREFMPLSTLPTLVNGRIEPRSLMLRTFQIARDGDYLLMPGALTRVARDSDSAHVSGQQGGISKDTWVIASEPRREFTLLRGEGDIQRGGGEVARHAAENLFWLGRYMERGENTLRLLREVLRWMDAPRSSRPPTFPALLRALTHLTTAYPGFTDEEALDGPALEENLFALIQDESMPGSLAYNLNAALARGQETQDLLAEDAWRILNSLREPMSNTRDPARALEELQSVLTRMAGFGGLVGESMVRVVSFFMLDMGRRLERALNSLALIRSVWAESERDDFLMERLLSVGMSLRTYRWRYPGLISEDTVLDLLLLDESNPRSIAFQTASLQATSAKLPGKDDAPRTREDRLLLEAFSHLRLADPRTLVAHEDGGREHETGEERNGRLLEFVTTLNDLLRDYSDALHEGYLARVEVPRLLIDT